MGDHLSRPVVANTRVCQLEGGLKARPLDFTGFEGYKN